MTAAELAASAVRDSSPPPEYDDAIRALWLAKAGDWHAAHDLCQEMSGKTGAWIHAYLHREEGDLGNAAYWYARAGRSAPPDGTSLEEEWMEMATELL